MSVGEIADKTDMIERIARACYAGKDEAKGLINEFDYRFKEFKLSLAVLLLGFTFNTSRYALLA